MARFFLFDKFNTYWDWGLILNTKDIPAAEPKTNYVNLDGVSGTIDLSESLTGEVAYSDRTLTASFSMSGGDYKTRDARIREIMTALHGRKVRIIEPDDPGHYYLGRVRIDSVYRHEAYATIDIEATCDPWRYAATPTTRTVDVAGEVAVVLRNEGVKTVVPDLVVTGVVALSYEGQTVELPVGSYKVTGLRLIHGANVVTLTGQGSVIFSYTEADV